MRKKKKVTESMEDYLEAIAELQKKNTIARVSDIGRMMNVKTSSVTSALMTLSRAGLVVHERYGYVELTPEGKRLARDIQRRHDLLLAFLTKILNIDHDIATVDACKIEHSISPETFKKLTLFIEFVEKNPLNERPAWLKSFDYFVKTGKRRICRASQRRRRIIK